MIGRTNGGVGTGALLIKVVGGLTRPENPTYGTVWLETEVPINGWQIFSVSPTWEAPEGHVYLQDAPSTSGEIPNFTMIDPGKKPYGCIWERLIGAFQRINGAWLRLNGAVWRDGVWTPFFGATIHVTYPAGSTCTATDGVTTLAAPDTSGTWDCVVPNAGTWTVTAKTSDAAHIARQQVSITSSGQMASVALSYNLMIYDNGTINSNIGMTTDGYIYSDQNEKNVTFGSTSIDIEKNTNVAGTTLAVDVTNYSTLRVTMESGNKSNTFQPWCALCKIKETTGDNLINRTSPNSIEKITRRIDISSLSGSYYIVVASSSSDGGGTIYDIYLEY